MSLTYENGYVDGESSMHADFTYALDEVLPFSFEGPRDLAKKLEAHLKQLTTSGLPVSQWRTMKSYVEDEWVLGWYSLEEEKDGIDGYVDLISRRKSSWYTTGDPSSEPDFWMPLPEGPSAEETERLLAEDET